jgi:thioredoxin-related protein
MRPSKTRAATLFLLAAALGAASAIGSAFAATTAGPAWSTKVGEAFAAARASGKPMLVDLQADWCGWCKMLERDVFPTPLFSDYARGFVLLRVDVEDGGDGSEMASRYGVESLPNLLMLEPSGALVGRVTGYAPAADFVAQLRNVAAIHQKVIDGYHAALISQDLERVRSTADELYARRDGERAAALYARLVGSGRESGDEAGWLHFLYADSLRRAFRFDEARVAAAAATRAGAGTKDPELGERLALLPFWIARDAERCAAASDALALFEREHPQSLFLPGARRALAQLRDHGARCT